MRTLVGAGFERHGVMKRRVMSSRGFLCLLSMVFLVDRRSLASGSICSTQRELFSLLCTLWEVTSITDVVQRERERERLKD